MGNSNFKRLQQIAFIFGAALLALGCTIFQKSWNEVSKNGGPTFRTNGPQAKQTRSLQDFDKIDAGSIYQVDVSFGSTPSIIIEAPRDLLPHLTSTVRGGTLSLSADVNFSTQNNATIKAHVVTKRLVGATVSGAGKMVINGKIRDNRFDANAYGASTLKLSADVTTFKLEASGAAKTITSLTAKTLEIQASGAANCSVDGTVDSSSIDASGAAHVDGRLTSNSAYVQTSGAAHAALRVVNALKGEASGASSITYGGRPGKVTTQTSGVSSIHRES